MTASIRGGIFTMAMLLKGAEVAKALTEELHAKTEELKKNGVEPCLASCASARVRMTLPMSAVRLSAAKRSASPSVRSFCPRM